MSKIDLILGPDYVTTMSVFDEPDIAKENTTEASVMISKSEECLLRRRMLECGLADLVRECDVPIDPRGRSLTAGLFAVAHKAGADRLIIDRRPQNCTEGRLNWAELPHGTVLCRIRFAPGESLRGFWNDLSN